MRFPVALQGVADFVGGDLAGADVGDRQQHLLVAGDDDVDGAAAAFVDPEAFDVGPGDLAGGAAGADDEVARQGADLEAQRRQGEEGDDEADAADQAVPDGGLAAVAADGDGEAADEDDPGGDAAAAFGAVDGPGR